MLFKFPNAVYIKITYECNAYLSILQRVILTLSNNTRLKKRQIIRILISFQVLSLS